MQLVWNGVAVANKLAAENPALIERFLRSLAKGREFARRYKEPTIAMIAKHNPAPAEALAVDYDTALGSMTEEGSVSDDVLREEILTRAELIKAVEYSRAGQILRLQRNQKDLRRSQKGLEAEVVIGGNKQAIR